MLSLIIKLIIIAVCGCFLDHFNFYPFNQIVAACCAVAAGCIFDYLIDEYRWRKATNTLSSNTQYQHKEKKRTGCLMEKAYLRDQQVARVIKVGNKGFSTAVTCITIFLTFFFILATVAGIYWLALSVLAVVVICLVSLHKKPSSRRVYEEKTFLTFTDVKTGKTRETGVVCNNAEFADYLVVWCSVMGLPSTSFSPAELCAAGIYEHPVLTRRGSFIDVVEINTIFPSAPAHLEDIHCPPLPVHPSLVKLMDESCISGLEYMPMSSAEAASAIVEKMRLSIDFQEDPKNRQVVHAEIWNSDKNRKDDVIILRTACDGWAESEYMIPWFGRHLPILTGFDKPVTEDVAFELIHKANIPYVKKTMFEDNHGQVYVTGIMSDGSIEHLIAYFADELSFSSFDFIGKTKEECIELHHKRDVAYLQS